MGGPWRERGFDPAALKLPRPRHGERSGVTARAQEQDATGKVVLAFIAAVVMSFGLMLSLLHSGW